VLTSEEKIRIAKIDELFLKTFHKKPTVHFKSTGRLEIIGNHTDHNSGICMVSSVDNLNIFASASIGEGNSFILKSEGYREIAIQLSSLAPRANEKGKSSAFVRGILSKFKELGYKIGPIDLSMDSNIYKGAGVSSSAAYCVLVCKVISYFYNNDSIDTITIAKVSRYAENVYFGKSSGLLDQIGCCSKGFSLVDFKDQNNPVVLQIKPDFTGYSLLLVNTMTDHSDSPDAYTSIPTDMKYIAGLFGKKDLREVNETEFFNRYAKERNNSPRAWDRSYHYFKENERVLQAFNAIKNHDMKDFLKQINDSGLSSEEYLKNITLEGEESNNFLVALHMAREFLKDDGAVRVHGGGFGGTIICFVKNEQVQSFIVHMATRFEASNIKLVNTCLSPLRVISEDEIK
jgi:galactokinase